MCYSFSPLPPLLQFGFIMKQLSRRANSEAAWSRAFASLPPPEAELLRGRGVGSYAQYQENQRQYQERRAERKVRVVLW